MVQTGTITKTISNIEDTIKQERAMILDANIVRIMKARKVLLHQDLLKEVFNQITLFKPQPNDIKKRIESLIEKEYLDRDVYDKSKYIYKP